MNSSSKNEAQVYNDSRRMVFSIYHKDGFNTALRFLETSVKGNLKSPAYLGLKQELYFYDEKRDEFKLTVSADVGEHSDFSGLYKGKVNRFDVTTNIDYKKLDDYSPFQGDPVDYQIVLMDKKTNEVEDIFDINFPPCEECDSRLFEVLLVTPHTSIGTGNRIYGISDATVIELCQYDPIFHSRVITSDTFSGLIDYPTLFGDMPDENEFNEVGFDNYKSYEEMISAEHVKQALIDVKYFRKTFDRNIVATGSPEFTLLDKHHEHWQTHFYWVNPIVSGHLEDVIDDDLDNVD